MDTSRRIEDFDPNAVATGDGIFGLPFDTEKARQIVVPVPWEATVSYRQGTAHAPSAVLEASKQVDLYDMDVKDAWKFGIAMDEIPQHLVDLNEKTRQAAQKHIERLQRGDDRENGAALADRENRAVLAEINANCQRMNEWVRERSRIHLDRGKLVYVLGGDHSAPLGLIEELSDRHQNLGILHIDAHCDLRNAYEGFEFSHASIMFNVLERTNVDKLVQVGIRDFCEEEVELIEKSDGRIVFFPDRELKTRLFDGESWRTICDDIIEKLPQSVYVSFDIDGLDPKLCPSTGTPVPGGLEFEESLYLIGRVIKSGRRLVGFDLCEVVPGDDDWDANVAARILYRVANLTVSSNLHLV